MIDVEAIKARLAAATPGPWVYEKRVGHRVVMREGKPGEVMETWARCEADAILCAHAPADLAGLLAEAERLTRERDEAATARSLTGEDLASALIERDEARADVERMGRLLAAERETSRHLHAALAHVAHVAADEHRRWAMANSSREDA